MDFQLQNHKLINADDPVKMLLFASDAGTVAFVFVFIFLSTVIVFKDERLRCFFSPVLPSKGGRGC